MFDKFRQSAQDRSSGGMEQLKVKSFFLRNMKELDIFYCGLIDALTFHKIKFEISFRILE